jgi:hypothetical protein
MAERYVDRVHSEHAVLDIGDNVGALIIYTRPEMSGKQIDVSPRDRPWARVHTDVLERRANGCPVFAALFLALAEDDYFIWGASSEPIGEFSIAGGQVSEVNWQHLLPSVFLSLASTSNQCAPGLLPDLLPARYHNSKQISAAPMGTAPMLYNEQGEVAWEQMWTSFCDLALAGGPSHRGTLLEPVPIDEIRADPEGYEHVLAELERGLRLVTGLSVERCRQAGWIGLCCDNEEMALWLLRAIVVENVCVRREGPILYLPAGPHFQLEKEMKNVITVVAKTHHYWTEHTR